MSLHFGAGWASVNLVSLAQFSVRLLLHRLFQAGGISAVIMASPFDSLRVSFDPRTVEAAVGRAKVRAIEGDGSLVFEDGSSRVFKVIY